MNTVTQSTPPAATTLSPEETALRKEVEAHVFVQHPERSGYSWGKRDFGDSSFGQRVLARENEILRAAGFSG